MPGTPTKHTVTDWGKQRINPTSPLAIASLPNPLSLDILQIYGEGGDVVLNVNSAGVVNKVASSPTSQCLFGRYYTRLATSATIAAIFADVYSQNNAHQDVFQLRGQGESHIYHLDYLGVAYSDTTGATISPTSAAIGASLTISGTGFGSSQGGSTVSINGIPVVTYSSWSNSSVVVLIPVGANTGPVVMVVGGLSIFAGTLTLASTPVIVSLSETSGHVADPLTITGTGFNATQGTGTAKVNGTLCVITSWSATSIVTAVPAGATTGNVVVHQNGVDSNGVAITIS